MVPENHALAEQNGWWPLTVRSKLAHDFYKVSVIFLESVC